MEPKDAGKRILQAAIDSYHSILLDLRQRELAKSQKVEIQPEEKPCSCGKKDCASCQALEKAQFKAKPKPSDDPNPVASHGEHFEAKHGSYFMAQHKGGKKYKVHYVSSSGEFKHLGEHSNRKDAVSAMHLHHDQKVAGLGKNMEGVDMDLMALLKKEAEDHTRGSGSKVKKLKKEQMPETKPVEKPGVSSLVTHLKGKKVKVKPENIKKEEAPAAPAQSAKPPKQPKVHTAAPAGVPAAPKAPGAPGMNKAEIKGNPLQSTPGFSPSPKESASGTQGYNPVPVPASTARLAGVLRSKKVARKGASGALVGSGILQSTPEFRQGKLAQSEKDMAKAALSMENKQQMKQDMLQHSFKEQGNQTMPAEAPKAQPKPPSAYDAESFRPASPGAAGAIPPAPGFHAPAKKPAIANYNGLPIAGLSRIVGAPNK